MSKLGMDEWLMPGILVGELKSFFNGVKLLGNISFYWMNLIEQLTFYGGYVHFALCNFNIAHYE